MRLFFAVLLLSAGLQPGPQPVGYRRVEGVDLWYPAEEGGRAMTFRDYLKRDEKSELLDHFIADEVIAKADAPAQKKKYPLVLIAQGNGEDAADQAILSEYLASNGFVVASVPSPMIAKAMTSESQIASFAEEQADALEKARKVAISEKLALPKRTVVIGHSFGARSALLLTMRDSGIRALISLDGGIGTATGTAELEAAPSFRKDAKVPPLMHIYEELDPSMKPDFTLLHEVHSASLNTMQTIGMHHIHFTTYGFAAAAHPEVAKATSAGDGIKDAVTMTALTVLDFVQRNTQ